jgi:hypothetical protein
MHRSALTTTLFHLHHQPPHPLHPFTPPEFQAAVRLLSLVRAKWPRQFKAWVLRVSANVGSDGRLGAPPAAPDGGGAGAFIHLLTRAEEAQVLDWPQWPAAPVGKAADYLKVGRIGFTFLGGWGAGAGVCPDSYPSILLRTKRLTPSKPPNNRPP